MKFVNTPIESLRSRINRTFLHRQGMIYCRNIESVCFNGRSVSFDFADPRFVHLGDILFFIPLILTLLQNKILITIAVNPVVKELMSFLFSEYQIQYVDALDKKFHDPVITTLTNLSKQQSQDTGIAFYGFNGDSGLTFPFEMERQMLDFLRLEYFDPNLYSDWRANLRHRCRSQLSKSDQLNTKIFLCPFLGSGRFRDFFGVKQKNICEFVRHKSRSLPQPTEVFLIGGEDDQLSVSFNGFDYDRRGYSLLDNLMLAARSEVICGVGFDNFWMHWFDIVGKQYYCKFRGRLTADARDLHYRSVNLAFLDGDDRSYI